MSTEDFAEVTEAEPQIVPVLATIGHNSSVKTALEKSYTDIIRRSRELQAAIATIPARITSEDMQKKASDLAAMMMTCADQAERARVEEKRPFLDGERQVDQFFAAISEPLRAGRDLLRERGGAFLVQHSVATVRSDNGAAASVRMEWHGTVVDRNKLNARSLLPFLSDDILQKAVNSWMRVNRDKLKSGKASLAGVVFEERPKANYRR